MSDSVLSEAPSVSDAPASKSAGRAPGELGLVLILGIIQFTVAVDFVIMMPLGPQLMRAFTTHTRVFGTWEFNTAVGAYALAAGVSGFLAAFFLDRLDRKRALLGLYGGFAVATLLCGLAPGYIAMVAARALAGAFGGVVGGTALAIVGDVVPEARRGAAVGMVMSGFALAQIAGVPAGLYFANKFGWHTPFIGLAAASALVWMAAAIRLPSVRTHLGGAAETAWARMGAILLHANHLCAFALSAIITLAGFMVVTDLATYMVTNVRLTQEQLPLMYLIGGCCTLFSMNLIGRMADRFGKRRVYAIMIVCAAGITLWVTHLPVLPLWMALGSTCLFMISMSGRYVPALALMTGAVERRHRGGFMTINSAISQLSSASGSFFAGLIVSQPAIDGPLRGFGTVGWVSAALSLTTLAIVSRLRQVVEPAVALGEGGVMMGEERAEI